MLDLISPILIVVMAVSLLCLVICLVRLRQQQTANAKLWQEMQRLENLQFAMSKGAVGLDQRLSESEQTLNTYTLKLDNVAHQINTPANYRLAIQNASAGKACDELIGNYGLTQGEADLLTGLHKH